MDSRAKQRLTGAVILVALFVLLVPELLTGPKGSQGAQDASEEGLRRYTIDLNTPNATPRETPADSPVALPPVNEAPAPALAVPGESAAVEAPSPEPVATPAATAPAAKPVPAPAASSVTTPAATPAAAPAAVPAKPATNPVQPAKPAPRAESGTFVVQLGSFGSKDNAERLVRDMTAKGFTTFIAPITTSKGELYRVRVGPTRDRASAEALATQLKRMGQSGSVVPIP